MRAGEVIPIDGIIISPGAMIDEPLTGEPIPVTRREEELTRSGTVNAGETSKFGQRRRREKAPMQAWSAGQCGAGRKGTVYPPRGSLCATAVSDHPYRRSGAQQMDFAMAISVMSGGADSIAQIRLVKARPSLSRTRSVPRPTEMPPRSSAPTTPPSGRRVTANRHSNVRVGTTHRSIAAMVSAWLRKNVCQICNGGPRCLIIYFETVD